MGHGAAAAALGARSTHGYIGVRGVACPAAAGCACTQVLTLEVLQTSGLAFLHLGTMVNLRVLQLDGAIALNHAGLGCFEVGSRPAAPGKPGALLSLAPCRRGSAARAWPWRGALAEPCHPACSSPCIQHAAVLRGVCGGEAQMWAHWGPRTPQRAPRAISHM